MKIVNQSVELLYITKDPEKFIEYAGRTCYKSHDKITDNSASKFVKMLKDLEHHSVLEHAYASFKIITDRGISHEIVRHRLASYSQESTRYCAYNDFIEVIPPYKIENIPEAFKVWSEEIERIESSYKKLLELGVSPQHARDILPTCLKTELIMTANFREWLHFINVRDTKSAHPKIRYIAQKIKELLSRHAPNIFS